MGRLLDACDALAAAVTAAGVPASLERARVHPPGAWIVPQTMELTTLGGGGTATVDIVLVAGDTGDRPALDALEAMLDRVLALDLPLSAPIDTTWALVLTGSPLPAFRLVTQLDL